MNLGTYGKVGLLGGVLAFVGALLPWWNVSAAGGGVSVSVPVLGIFTIGGILAALFGIIGIVFARMKPSVPTVGLTLAMGAMTAVASLVWGAMFPTASVSGGGASASISAGFGFWISLVGGVLLVLAGVIGFGETKKVPTSPTPTM